MARRRLAAVFPHPDDESLFAGGLLARAARDGAQVRLLCLTRGEAGWSRFGDAGRALGERRHDELRDACRALGIDAPEVLDLPDGGLDAFDDAQLCGMIEAWLDATQPDVVVGFGPDGAYGHPDHVTCCQRTRAAVALRKPPLRLLETAFVPGHFRRVHRILGPFVKGLLPFEALGEAPRPDALRLPLAPAIANQKRAAVAAHTSQLPNGDPDRALAPGALATLCESECFHVAWGPPLPADGSDDPFEGLP